MSNTDESNNGTNHIEDKEKHLLYKNVTFHSKEYTFYVQIVKDMYNEYDFMKILFWVMAIADFIGIIVSVVVGQMVSKRMLKPIDSITKAAENITISNLKERIITSNGPDDELKRLANTFNKMIDRLQDAFDKQVQSVSDASHELRTPIAVIQGYANLLDRWGKNDKDALEKSIYSIKLEAANMANLVEKLLFLARGDISKQRIEKGEFNLNKLMTEVIEDSKLMAQNHIITSSKNVEVCRVADFNMLKQMLRIFIEKRDSGNIKQETITKLHNMKDDELRYKFSNKIQHVNTEVLKRESSKPHGSFEISDMEVPVRYRGKRYYLCMPFKSGAEIKKNTVPVDAAYQIVRPFIEFKYCVVIFVTAKKCSEIL